MMEAFKWTNVGLSSLWLVITLLFGGIFSYFFNYGGFSYSNLGNFAQIVVWLMFTQCALQLITTFLPRPLLRIIPIPVILFGAVNTVMFIIILSNIIQIFINQLDYLRQLEIQNQINYSKFQYNWGIFACIVLMGVEAAVTVVYALFFYKARKDADTELRQRLSEY